MRKIIGCLLVLWGLVGPVEAQFGDYRLIAHRGGVVDDKLEENSIASLVEAARRGYWMVEIDVRMTKDSVLVAHHDGNLKRFFGSDNRVQDMTFQQLQGLVSNNGNRVERLQTLLDVCRREELQVMIDLKVKGFHQHAFSQIVTMLAERDLQRHGLIIPSAEATDFFRGKLKLSCSKEQILAYQLRPDYAPAHYYLFANPSTSDMRWAKQQDIQVVGVINYRVKSNIDYQAVADGLKELGLQYIQLDSRFEDFFRTDFSKKDSLFFKEGKFKIAQFTDFHWDQRSKNTLKTKHNVETVLRLEKPDVAILTGDVVASIPAREGWDSVARIFEDHQIPWMLTLGNHDDEVGMSREEVFEYLNDKPYFIGQKGPDISGAGNYVIPVYGRKGKVEALLYALDTHNQPIHKKYGHYNWVQFDQIKWFRETSRHYRDRNGGKPFPALAFLHIPLPEFKQVHRNDKVFLGNASDGVGSARLNSGLFTSFIEMGDVMGVFSGHNHNNDYIGKYLDVALAFGRTTGEDAYGDLERGARIIELEQGQRNFTSWIRTPSTTEFKYYYPSGITAADEKEMKYRDPVAVSNPREGLAYRYYQGGRFQKVDDIFISGKLVKSGYVDSINLDIALATDSFAVEFKGLIDIPEIGVYNFYTYSDDGSQLFIGGELVVDNDGSRSARRIDGKIALKKGFHPIRILYFEDYMGEALDVGISSREITERLIPARMYRIAP